MTQGLAHTVDGVGERLGAPSAPSADKWLPINTAPRDGTRVDIWSVESGRITDAFWHSNYRAWAIKQGYPVVTTVLLSQTVTHWRPIPLGPDADGAIGRHVETDPTNEGEKS